MFIFKHMGFRFLLQLPFVAGFFISDPFDRVFGRDPSEGCAPSGCRTAHQVGVASGEVVSGAVAYDIEALDRASVGANCMQIVIDLDAVHGADKVAAALACAEVRSSVESR